MPPASSRRLWTLPLRRLTAFTTSAFWASTASPPACGYCTDTCTCGFLDAWSAPAAAATTLVLLSYLCAADSTPAHTGRVPPPTLLHHAFSRSPACFSALTCRFTSHLYRATCHGFILVSLHPPFYTLPAGCVLTATRWRYRLCYLPAATTLRYTYAAHRLILCGFFTGSALLAWILSRSTRRFLDASASPRRAACRRALPPRTTLCLLTSRTPVSACLDYHTLPAPLRLRWILPAATFRITCGRLFSACFLCRSAAPFTAFSHCWIRSRYSFPHESASTVDSPWRIYHYCLTFSVAYSTHLRDILGRAYLLPAHTILRGIWLDTRSFPPTHPRYRTPCRYLHRTCRSTFTAGCVGVWTLPSTATLRISRTPGLSHTTARLPLRWVFGACRTPPPPMQITFLPSLRFCTAVTYGSACSTAPHFHLPPLLTSLYLP